jgi:hypothetical protein
METTDASGFQLEKMMIVSNSGPLRNPPRLRRIGRLPLRKWDVAKDIPQPPMHSVMELTMQMPATKLVFVTGSAAVYWKKTVPFPLNRQLFGPHRLPRKCPLNKDRDAVPAIHR